MFRFIQTMGHSMKINEIRKSPRIGEGGQSNVHRFPFEGRDCAIKVLNRMQKIERFKAEIANTKKLFEAKRRVSEILHSETGSNYSFYVMPIYNNGNLLEYWDVGLKDLSQNEKIEYFLLLASALDEIHEDGYLHRDIKAENILIDDDGMPLFGDLGLSKHVAEDSGLTATDEIIGSRHWTAPELHFGKHHFGSLAGDHYAMGKILYFILSGKRLLGIGPYTSESDFAEIPEDILPALKTMLSFDPISREKYYDACLGALRRFIGMRGVDQFDISDDLLKIDHLAEKHMKQVHRDSDFQTIQINALREIIEGDPQILLGQLAQKEMVTFEIGSENHLRFKILNAKDDTLIDHQSVIHVHRIYMRDKCIRMRYHPEVLICGTGGESNYNNSKICICIGKSMAYPYPQKDYPIIQENGSWIIEGDIDNPIFRITLRQAIISCKSEYLKALREMIQDPKWVIQSNPA